MKLHNQPFAIAVYAASVLMFSVPAVSSAEEPGYPPVEAATVSVQVYKKWIGASGDEANSEVHLKCDSSIRFEPRFINTDRTEGWDVPDVPASGMFCSVYEVERDTFIADVTDCKRLLLVQGEPVECTVVNTKVVKRIDMLNRYGLVIMISVMLGAGLAAVRRFAPM